MNSSQIVAELATVLGSLMGTIGSVALIITSLTNNVKSMSRHMIIMISLADVLQAFPMLVVSLIGLGKHEYGQTPIEDWLGKSGCKLQSFIITMGAMLTFLWTFGLSQHLFLLLKYGIRVAHRAYMLLYLLSIVPVAVNALSFYYDVLGSDKRHLISSTLVGENNTSDRHLLSWCWINVTEKSQHNGTWMKQSCPAAMWNGKGFEIFAYIGVTVYCLLAWHQYRKVAERGSINETDSVIITSGTNLQIDKIMLIPILFIATRIWGTISRLACYCVLSNRVCTFFPLIVIQNFTDTLQGFVNFILFKVLLQNNCSCDCLQTLRLNIRTQEAPRSGLDPETVYVLPDSSESLLF